MNKKLLTLFFATAIAAHSSPTQCVFGWLVDAVCGNPVATGFAVCTAATGLYSRSNSKEIERLNQTISYLQKNNSDNLAADLKRLCCNLSLYTNSLRELGCSSDLVRSTSKDVQDVALKLFTATKGQSDAQKTLNMALYNQESGHWRKDETELLRKLSKYNGSEGLLQKHEALLKKSEELQKESQSQDMTNGAQLDSPLDTKASQSVPRAAPRSANTDVGVQANLLNADVFTALSTKIRELEARRTELNVALCGDNHSPASHDLLQELDEHRGASSLLSEYKIKERVQRKTIRDYAAEMMEKCNEIGLLKLETRNLKAEISRLQQELEQKTEVDESSASLNVTSATEIMHAFLAESHTNFDNESSSYGEAADEATSSHTSSSPQSVNGSECDESSEDGNSLAEKPNPKRTSPCGFFGDPFLGPLAQVKAALYDSDDEEEPEPEAQDPTTVDQPDEDVGPMKLFRGVFSF